MPANFPTTEQKRYYGRFVEAPTPEQLGSYFHLADTDRSLLYSRTKEHTQLGVLGAKGRKPTLRLNQFVKAATRKVLHHPLYQNGTGHIALTILKPGIVALRGSVGTADHLSYSDSALL